MSGLSYSSRILTLLIWVFCGFALPSTGHAAWLNDNQQLFASPEEALKALEAAVQSSDTTTLDKILGPEAQDLLTGDSAQDRRNAQKFAAAMAQGYVLVKEGDDKVSIEIGTNNWPLPIPLVKTSDKKSWVFDTAAGKEEIVNRHIGKDELHAIGVCRAFVTAQQQYASMNPGADKGLQYAQQLSSTSGKTDGLYWPSTQNAFDSPLGPMVARADIGGYLRNKGPKPEPFHGYFFKILTRQGKTASGGSLNYMSHGRLTKGFALVAYPVRWGQSGIMTFMINQDGKVFEQNLGEMTPRIAERMREYNPDREWTFVEDEGVVGAITEK